MFISPVRTPFTYYSFTNTRLKTAKTPCDPRIGNQCGSVKTVFHHSSTHQTVQDRMPMKYLKPARLGRRFLLGCACGFRLSLCDSLRSNHTSSWGNSPAIDIINLSYNENDPKCDLNLAFPGKSCSDISSSMISLITFQRIIASGDLRHAIFTVNNLPDNFSGDLKLVINDRTPHVTSRNMVILLVLGMIPDEDLAADIALHFWYSVFFPAEYKLRISAIVTRYLSSASKDNGISNFPLGPRSSLSCTSIQNLLPFLSHILTQSRGLGEFQTAYDSVRKAPERQDFRDRMYAGLRPSHRVAFQEYRRFGIILPFGAINAYFNTPNNSLFSFDAQWLQTDFADPLGGWEYVIFRIFASVSLISSQDKGCRCSRKEARHARGRHLRLSLFLFDGPVADLRPAPAYS